MQINEIAKERSPKNKRVGVIGGGQLAWMMADAAKSLGISLIVQTPSRNDPAVAIATETIFAPIDDSRATAKLASRCDVITFENEFIDLDGLLPLSQQGVCFRPSLSALTPLLDKYDQLRFLQDLGLPVPKFAKWPEIAVKDWGKKVVLKTRRHGYDGRGTFIVEAEADFKAVLAKLGDRPILVQEFVPFVRELGAIAARSVSGEVAVYPVVETQQENEVCRRAIAPADITLQVQMQIEAIAETLLEGLDAVGVFGIELFLTAEGKVLVNEIAPRTHNSGHFTLDACETSQFEQLLRAVCGLPLGSTRLKSAGAVMVNLLGYEVAEDDYLTKRQQLAEILGASVWWYGKRESRPGRKLGHVTVLLEAENPSKVRDEAEAIAQTIESLWYSKK